MKKNRNAFFNEQKPMFLNPNMNIPNFYQNPPINYDYEDISERLAKIERQITRLEKRINKIETTSSLNEDFETNSNNMYML